MRLSVPVSREEREALLAEILFQGVGMEDQRVCAAPWCCKPLVRHEGETLQNFLKRRYCDRRCAVDHRGDRAATQKKRRMRFGAVRPVC